MARACDSYSAVPRSTLISPQHHHLCVASALTGGSEPTLTCLLLSATCMLHFLQSHGLQAIVFLCLLLCFIFSLGMSEYVVVRVTSMLVWIALYVHLSQIDY